MVPVDSGFSADSFTAQLVTVDSTDAIVVRVELTANLMHGRHSLQYCAAVP